MNIEKKMHDYLKKTFGFTDFKVGQKEVIQNLLTDHSTVAILPTGTGKSLCYQFYGKYTQQTVLIISPLLSLMQDQVEQLRLNGEKRVVAINSNLKFQEKKQVLRNLAHFSFIYLAPEMLRNEDVLRALSSIHIGLLVIDEAHCISAWGPDFRPDYLKLGQVRSQLNDPLTLAVTATATDRVLKDMLSSLNLSANTKVIRHSVDRPNIYLASQKTVDEKDKDHYLIDFAQRLPAPGLVYFSSKKQCDKTGELLQQKTGLRVASYHAGLSFSERYAVQQQFLNGQLDVICATSAFGMGINKPDIRYVIHYHMPQDLESYVQEIGRAGRDSKQSIAIVLFSENDQFLQRRLALGSLPSADELEIYQRDPEILKNASQENESAELVMRYRQMGVDFAKMNQIFAQRRLEKLHAIQQMVNYVSFSECKRNFILKYFNEVNFVKHGKYCCQIGEQNIDIESLFKQTKAPKPEKKKELPASYQEILQKLFKVSW
ncbi:RecQ family ATP-dependent DNA helicase [Ligilactobacillus pobuzihii]|uniref:RecQ family ATP-dependent DNA helicase n=1 Tax=Ligilactobacillus pobuzihii TaxID=449659 RepID=UPI0019D257ED|nr:ATP-dependent DNA helicase RecQ [Ligilactobacillus pobuzihii]MBN7275304.1 RecQ family ATP-dependent DNA helicase [Ligilactobacillus pobuzihii]